MATTLPFSLTALRSHAIFVPPASSSTDEGWEIVETAALDEGLPAPKNSRVALRDKYIVVALGKEIRMTSLAGAGWEINSGSLGGYKTLKSPHLTFNIHSLVLNPTGRLLAVVGHHQLVILVLPRSGFASSIGGDVACHSFPVDEYQHSPSSDNAITKVRWHTWGESGNSLWVMTADGQLFEYDVLRPKDPVQSFNFLADKSKGGSKFSAIDPLSQYATSFSFGHGTLDFGPLMVYALMANGDVYTMGPVLPLHAEVPAVYLQNLRAWVAEKQRRLKEDGKQGAEHASVLGRVGLQVQWVDALVRQADRESEEPPSPAKSHRRGFGLREPSPEPTPERTPPRPGFVHLHPPHLTATGSPATGVHRPLLRQGPALFDPAPQEVGNGDEIDEQIASDIIVFPAAVEGPTGPTEPINVVGIAWTGGRIDIGIEESAPEPRWLTSRDPGDNEIVIPIIESVLASYPAGLEPEAFAANAPVFVADPIHMDVFYVQSAFSMDTVSVAPWIGKLLSGDDELPPSDVAALVVASPNKPLVGSATFCNITLGYGLMALAAGGQLVAVEMDMRVADRDPLPVPEPEKPMQDGGDSQQLLTRTFQPKLDEKATNPLGAVRKLGDSNKKLDTIGPEHLRAMADAAAQINARAEAVRSASAKVEARVDLQVQEYGRQLKLLRETSSALGSIQAAADEQAERTEALVDAQASLASRLDAVLNAMLAEYRPQIGEVERKWFDELERIKARIGGRKGISHRSRILKEQLDVVRPLAQKSKSDHEANYGSRQLRPLEQALGERSDELARLMRKMDALSVKVEGVQEEDEE